MWWRSLLLEKHPVWHQPIRKNESSAVEARELLNSTLMDRDVSFFVIGSDLSKTELKLARTSLGVIPSKWAPTPSPPSFNGYTGGSMFVLGVFMLLLGVGIGVGGMFFVWKRQRITGLAYQVFE
uniref:Peptidase_M16_C domain-containing protein n=1 Tax=Ascaris lumbricoides TaxID=6252 RepID=A0A0M3IVU2_ASCLU